MNIDHTLAETGQQFSVTRGEPLALGLDPRGIRQIEAKALRKLKHPSRSRCLCPLELSHYRCASGRVWHGSEAVFGRGVFEDIAAG